MGLGWRMGMGSAFQIGTLGYCSIRNSDMADTNTLCQRPVCCGLLFFQPTGSLRDLVQVSPCGLNFEIDTCDAHHTEFGGL